MLYLDAARDRKGEDVREAIDTARAATIFAHDQRQYVRWSSRADHRAGRPGKGLAQLVHDVGANVVVGEFEFREAG